jgi:protease-4
MKKSPLVLVLSLFSLGFFAVVGIAALSVLDLKGGASTSGVGPLFTSSSKTRLGVIEINGVIMDSKKIVEQIDKFHDSSSISGVIIRINSPGGAVAPSQEIYDAIKRLNGKKPVYASMGSVAASGGYYVALGGRKIYADAGTLTGSIGVIMQFIDMSKLYQWAKVAPYSVKTGKYKDLGATEREMTPEEKALLQELLDNVLGQFRKAVVENRKLPLDRVIELSDGRIFSGEQAKSVKLIDELGGLYEAAKDMVAEVNGKGKPVLVYPKKQRQLLIEKLFEEDENTSESNYADDAKLFSSFTAFLARTMGLPIKDLLETSVGGAAHAGATGLMYLMPMGH